MKRPALKGVRSVPALKLALEEAEVEENFRSRLELKVAKQLKAAGIEFEYEKRKVPYKVPARDAFYLVDFDVEMIIETKGRFGHRGSGGAKERQKYILIKLQHPALDIRFVFQNAKLTIYKGSKTTYAMWADEHGFPWADKGVVPDKWIKEIKNARSKNSSCS